MLGTTGLTGAEARRERGRQEMRTAILDAAGRLIESEGFDGLTIRAVAQAVGYSAGALYEYFDSKEAILTSLYFDSADGLGVQCERAVAELPPAANALDALHALGQAYRAYALDHAELYRLVFGGFKTPPPPREAVCPGEERGGFGTLMRIAAQGVDEGSLRDLPPPVIAFAAWSAVHGFVSLELLGHITGADQPREPVASETDARHQRDLLYERVLEMALAGFMNEEGRKRLDGPDHVPAGTPRH